MEVTLVQRLPRNSDRQKMMHIQQKKMSVDALPRGVLSSALSVCQQCTQRDAQWYVYAVKTEPDLGLTNGVFPGFKCNRCKEEFLRQYLRPNWIIENDHISFRRKTWQQYCLIPLPSSPINNPGESSVHLLE